MRDRVSNEEWLARVDLAACYRLVHHYGMDDLVYNHISARVPGEEGHFLINAYGMMYDEITASSLVKIDFEGKVVLDSGTGYGINHAGFVIHSAVHKGRPDIGCVIHTHSIAGMAVSALDCGLLPLTQTAMYFDGVGMHDYESVAIDLDEQKRLVRDLGNFKAMILRNHGLARGRRHGFRGLHQPVLARARVQGAGGGDGVQHQAAPAGAGCDREDRPPLPARDAPALGAARVAGPAAPGRPEVPRLPRLKQLEGKSIVVTGAGGGIGRDFALAMAARRRQRAGQRHRHLGEGRRQGRRARRRRWSTRSRANGGKAVASTRQRGGVGVAPTASCKRRWTRSAGIDVVVNNAGILRDRFFFNMSVEEWRAVIDVHLNGSFYVSRAAATHFKSQESGCYVHMTSTSGLVGNLGQANYSAAKLGIAALSKSIALDMARYNVRSNCIAPFAWSRMIGSIPTETEDQKARVEKLKSMETAKIAPLAVFLASGRKPKT